MILGTDSSRSVGHEGRHHSRCAARGRTVRPVGRGRSRAGAAQRSPAKRTLDGPRPTDTLAHRRLRGPVGIVRPPHHELNCAPGRLAVPVPGYRSASVGKQRDGAVRSHRQVGASLRQSSSSADGTAGPPRPAPVRCFCGPLHPTSVPDVGVQGASSPVHEASRGWSAYFPEPAQFLPLATSQCATRPPVALARMAPPSPPTHTEPLSRANTDFNA